MRTFGMRKLFLLALFTLALPLQARTDQQFAFQAEWLYMAPSINNPIYGINKSTNAQTPIGTAILMDQDLYSGFRLGVEWCSCFTGCRPLEVRWCRFDFTESDSFTGRYGETLSTADRSSRDNIVGTLRSSQEFTFDYVEALIELIPFSHRCLNLSFQAGIAYFDFTFNEKINSEADFAGVSNVLDIYKTDVWGIGPEISLITSYSLFNCFSLEGRAFASLNASALKSSIFELQTLTSGAQSLQGDFSLDKDYWLLIPAFDVRLGLRYHNVFCFCSKQYNVHLEVGAEYITLRDAFYRIRFVDDEHESLLVTQYSNFSLFGPYVAFGIGF